MLERDNEELTKHVAQYSMGNESTLELVNEFTGPPIEAILMNVHNALETIDQSVVTYQRNLISSQETMLKLAYERMMVYLSRFEEFGTDSNITEAFARGMTIWRKTSCQGYKVQRYKYTFNCTGVLNSLFPLINRTLIMEYLMLWYC